MKKFNGVKKSLTLFMALCLAAGTLSGCGSSPASGEETGERMIESESMVTESSVPAETVQVPVNREDLSEGASLIASIQDNFAAGTYDENYHKGQYHLPKDYVFEFPCSFEAGMLAFKAFDVYASPDFEEQCRTYEYTTYEDGVIKVAPGGVVQLGTDRSRDVNDGTWGSLNQLYLVQYIDLETGEDLDQPIVTPFSIEHDLKAPVVTQGVDEKNNYTLSWQAVPGATEYAVYEYFGSNAYNLCCTTKSTGVSVEEFEKQRETENLLSLFKGDLSKAGYDVDFDGIGFMNSALRYNEELKDGYYLVVAFDAAGNASGISNLSDVRELGKNLPYCVKDSVVKGTIEKVTDLPAFVTVEMLDGSEAQMIIDYHGAQAYKYDDDPNKIGIKAHVANTMFDSFLLVMTGMPYQDVVDNIKEVLDREDEMLSNIRPAELASGALEITKEAPKEAEEMVPESSAVTEEPENTEPETAAASPAEQLMQEISAKVAHNIKLLGKETVDSVLFAESELEAWMAYCLIAQTDVIPVPVSKFPEAADLNYLFDLFLEAYRQNPTSGLIEIGKVQYNDKYEALIIPYKETPEVRLNKTVEELATAAKVAAEVCDASMSDYEKVFALNEYFRINASYDFDSMSTNVEISTASESFVDAHTPYGILCKNFGVCESYSEAFILTARMAGLEAIAEFGTLHGGGHEWNRVKVDGKWCVLDITNNDNDVFVNGLMNLSDAQMEGILVPSSQAYVDGSKFMALSDENEYYHRNGKYAATREEALQIVTEALKEADTVTFRPPVGTTQDEAREWMKYLAEQGTGIQRGGFNLGLILVEK